MSQWLLQVLNRYGKNGLHSLYEPCLWTLLLRARSIKALSTHLAAVPRSIHLSHLPLRHLEIFVCSRCTHSLALLLYDISHNCTLESFTLAFNPIDGVKGMRDSLQLPDMHLRSMPSLKHVRLDSCFPVGELSLPDDCSLFLEAVCIKDIMWDQHWEKLQRHTIILRLNTAELVDRPGGLQSFSKLQYLELKAKGNWTQDLAGLQHVPHVKVIADGKYIMPSTGGSWESLEIFVFGKLDASLFGVESFVRDIRSFTLMSESQHEASQELMRKIQDECLRQGKACHVVQHHDKQCGKRGAPKGKLVDYVILSTSKERAEKFPLVYYIYGGPLVSFERGKTLADPEDFWPCDPCASVRRTY